MLIHPFDSAIDESEWRDFVRKTGFGHLVAAGADREYPVVVPTQFIFVQADEFVEADGAEQPSGAAGAEILLHLARPNPVWKAIEENPRVVMSVAGDWAFIPGSWKAIGDEDPALGIPTTYYGAVQLYGHASVLTDPEEIAAVLRRQIGVITPGDGLVDPLEHGARLKTIRGIRIPVSEVRAKFKYGGNVDVEHRLAVAEHLLERDGPGDRAAVGHLEWRLEAEAARK